MIKTEWHIKETNLVEVKGIQEKFNIPEAIAKIMALKGIHNRKISSAFFKPSKNDLHDPFKLKGMQRAVNHIIKQKELGNKILIFGDYDVDGVSSTSILYLFLTSINIDVSYYIPHRDIDGYGLSNRGIDFAKEIGSSLIITCDCGINAFEEINYANSLNIDVIITDHHKPEEKIPDCISVINPHQKDCNYPFKGLCGAGVAFKLAFAIAEKLSIEPENVWCYADLATLGTAADMVPLIDENRIISHIGLGQIRGGNNLGISSLIRTSNLNINHITIGQISFWVTPKINAAGRLGDASRAVKLLTSNNSIYAIELAKKLHLENEKRKDITKLMEQESISMVDKQLEVQDKQSIVLYKEGWNTGIIGIVASRIKEIYNRPTVIIGVEKGVGKGSCRSIKNFDIVEALKLCDNFLEGFGGHPMAAGLTINEEKLDNFIDNFENICTEKLDLNALTPKIFIDCEIKLNEINSRMINFLKYLEPFGPQNAKPKFLSRNVHVDGIPKLLGKDQSTIKFNIKQKGSLFEAIGFKMINEYEKLIKNVPIDVVYHISENHFNGKISLQLEIKEIRYSNV
ncbi:MAG: single-stranded-DNA-specific exonuclease RecJ [Candidatus Marinimicrobia bacterium]|nr:single-stranded-DNA-specific exonuclease RecJ [Candidatus Neomarinimicrobiota bacterium]|tara:strand:- start:5234 stop:6946 length:1713 start_codon:yes stop_codon:yes gene_type:complete